MTYMQMEIPVQNQGTITRWVLNYFERRKVRVAQMQTVRALSALNHQALKDMAISRSEIYSLAYCDSNDRMRTRQS